MGDILNDVAILLEELNEASEDEDDWFELENKNYNMIDSNIKRLAMTSLQSEPLTKAKNESIIQPISPVKTGLKAFTLTPIKTDSKSEIKTDSDLTFRQEQFNSSNSFRRTPSDRPKRYVDDYNYSTSEDIYPQKRGKHSNSPTSCNYSPLVFDRSASYSSSHHSRSSQSSPFNGFSSSTAVENHDLSEHYSRPTMNRSFSNHYILKEEKPESFANYKPSTSKILEPPRSGDVVMVNKLEYKIIMPIGEGGSGKVFQALSIKYTDIFALKWVYLRDELDRKNVKNEIALMNSLRKSPYVISLCDSEITDQVAFMILEYGHTNFSDLIEAQTRLGWDITFFRHYWKQMLRAVSETHSYNIIHADLKPANFVLVRGCIKLIDFGIADRVPDDTTRIGRENQVGTANFMAPETLKDEGTIYKTQYKQGMASDVWSLGCILYQMIFSKPPFSHVPVANRINAIADPTFPIVFPMNTKYGEEIVRVPDELQSILKSCLNRIPTMRPTVKDLLSDPFIN